MKNKKILIISLGLSIALFNGCSAKGEIFHGFKTSKEKSTVYFYRPDSFINGSRTTGIFELDSNDTKYEKNMWGSKTIGKLRNNSYFKYEFNSGIHKFTDNMIIKNIIKTHLKKNDYSCIRLSMGLLMFNTIKEVDKKTCEKEIKETNEMTKEDLENKFY